jgi:hypothetical protein
MRDNLKMPHAPGTIMVDNMSEKGLPSVQRNLLIGNLFTAEAPQNTEEAQRKT